MQDLMAQKASERLTSCPILKGLPKNEIVGYFYRDSCFQGVEEETIPIKYDIKKLIESTPPP